MEEKLKVGYFLRIWRFGFELFELLPSPGRFCVPPSAFGVILLDEWGGVLWDGVRAMRPKLEVFSLSEAPKLSFSFPELEFSFPR